MFLLNCDAGDASDAGDAASFDCCYLGAQSIAFPFSCDVYCSTSLSERSIPRSYIWKWSNQRSNSLPRCIFLGFDAAYSYSYAEIHALKKLHYIKEGSEMFLTKFHVPTDVFRFYTNCQSRSRNAILTLFTDFEVLDSGLNTQIYFWFKLFQI